MKWIHIQIVRILNDFIHSIEWLFFQINDTSFAPWLIPFKSMGDSLKKTVIIAKTNRENKNELFVNANINILIGKWREREKKSSKEMKWNKKLIACRSNYRGGYPLHLYCYWEDFFLYWCDYFTLNLISVFISFSFCDALLFLMRRTLDVAFLTCV